MMSNLTKLPKSNTDENTRTLNPPKQDKKPSQVEDLSSSDDEVVDKENILNHLYQNYPRLDEKNGNPLAQTINCLDSLLYSGAATCLICLGSIRRQQPVWSCKNCYCVLHLNCIKRWAKDSLARLHKLAAQINQNEGYYNHMGEFVPPDRNVPIYWCCPQCRHSYGPNERPEEYLCFCGKTVDPAPDHYLVPHSCGEICGKKLSPFCGHECNILCHPGPCPPCPMMVNVSCLCQKSPSRTTRCMEKEWVCDTKCMEVLPCGRHRCESRCHKPGECPPCTRKGMYPCLCRKEIVERVCSDQTWQCKTICDKPYPCLLHYCDKTCHAGSCGECPLGLPRTCPCGKTKKTGPCTEPIDPCGDTCMKLLSCRKHYCVQQCHPGECPKCVLIVIKKCRCGLREKELPCSKEYLCETKCKRKRDCGKHNCNRKCCDGNCPPCEKVCAKTLPCRKHKCQAVCHDGPCYPCERTSIVNCSCGSTTRYVPCGRERAARILCDQPCRLQPKCHHKFDHYCHKNACPPCPLPCGLPNDVTQCGHLCEAKCHSGVRVLKSINNANTDVSEPRKTYEYLSTPHPRCEKMLSVSCLGGHQTVEMPCWNSKPAPCDRQCDRLLQCGNHRCTLPCHPVTNQSDMNAQEECEKCDRSCVLPRPKGCVHPCQLKCHAPPCAPCNMISRLKCHCGVNVLVYKCSEIYKHNQTDEELQTLLERLKCCGNRCLLDFPCGHRCNNICHSGPCLNPESCRKKVRLTCACKRLKSEVPCERIRNGLTVLPCDDSCKRFRDELQQLQDDISQKIRAEEDERARRELDEYNKLFPAGHKRKLKERKEIPAKRAKQINWGMLAIYSVTVLLVLVAFIVAMYDAEN